MERTLNKEIDLRAKGYDFNGEGIEGDLVRGDDHYQIQSIKIKEINSFKSRRGLKHKCCADITAVWDLKYYTIYEELDNEFYEDVPTMETVQGTAVSEITFEIDEGGIWNVQTYDADISVDLKNWGRVLKRKAILEDIIKNMEWESTQWIDQYSIEILEDLDIEWDKIKESKTNLEKLTLRELARRGKFLESIS